MNITIKAAHPNDAQTLTELTFSSKRYWGYPDAYMEIWRDELTITNEYIDNNTVFVAHINELFVGYYSIIHVQKETDYPRGYWLEHMFISPEYIRKGIGSQLLKHAHDDCLSNKINKIQLLSDPNAKEFYIKSGLTYLGEIPSNIEGRTVCQFEWCIR